MNVGENETIEVEGSQAFVLKSKNFSICSVSELSVMTLVNSIEIITIWLAALLGIQNNKGQNFERGI